MIQWIDSILYSWGRWAVRNEFAAVGFPASSAMFRDMPPSAVFESRLPFGLCEDDYKDVSDAVKLLPERERASVTLKYVLRVGRTKCCREMGCCDATFTHFIDMAHTRIERSLSRDGDKKNNRFVEGYGIPLCMDKTVHMPALRADALSDSDTVW